MYHRVGFSTRAILADNGSCYIGRTLHNCVHEAGLRHSLYLALQPTYQWQRRTLGAVLWVRCPSIAGAFDNLIWPTCDHFIWPTPAAVS